jgi:gluconate kinase
MAAREGHYMRPEMLLSQFAALEEPTNAFVLDVSMSAGIMIDKILTNYFPSERSFT